MIVYLLKSGVCLAAFFLFYKLFLEKENFHVFKRFYLIGGLVLAFVIPLITFTTIVQIEPIEYIPYTFSDIPIEQQMTPEVSTINYIPIILWTVYGFGMVLFGLKFLFNLFQIGNKIRNKTAFRVDIAEKVEQVAATTLGNPLFHDRHDDVTEGGVVQLAALGQYHIHIGGGQVSGCLRPSC